jgi:hypothetical protein
MAPKCQRRVAVTVAGRMPARILSRDQQRQFERFSEAKPADLLR